MGVSDFALPTREDDDFQEFSEPPFLGTPSPDLIPAHRAPPLFLWLLQFKALT